MFLYVSPNPLPEVRAGLGMDVRIDLVFLAVSPYIFITSGYGGHVGGVDATNEIA